MYFKYLNEPSLSRSMQSTFYGLNKNARIGEGEFADMANMSGDSYPLMSPRKKRSVVWKAPYDTVTETDADGNEVETLEYKRLNGILGDVGFAAVWGTDFYYMGEKVEDLELADSEKTMLSMGAVILIYPDEVYYNTVTGEYGAMDENSVKIAAALFATGFEVESFTFKIDGEEKTWSTASKVTLPCNIRSGSKKYTELTTGPRSERFFWGTKTSQLKRKPTEYSVTDYIVMGFDGEHLFYGYDAESVNVDGKVYLQVNEWRRLDVTQAVLTVNKEADNTDLLKDGASNIWSGNNYVKYEYSTSLTTLKGQITVETEGALGAYFSGFSAGVDVPLNARFTWQTRTLPVMDFVCEHENRLWGCHFGRSANGDESVNEIYCSALGDFKTWTLSSETSTLAGDPYTANVGDYGAFTGCISHRGYVLFSKENVWYRVSGTKPSNFQITKISSSGVQEGCERTMEIIDEVLYYKAKSGVYAYDGSLPQKISDNLGSGYYTDAVAGSLLSKYYITMKQGGVRKMYVYDTPSGLWHAEDGIDAKFFAEYDGALYAGAENNIVCISGSPAEFFGDVESEDDFEWFAESGDIGLSSPYQKYYHRLLIRMDMEMGARVKVSLATNGGEWLTASDFTAPNKRTVLMPVVTPRCDHMRFKISGKGEAKIYSISYETETVGDKP